MSHQYQSKLINVYFLFTCQYMVKQTGIENIDITRNKLFEVLQI